MADVLPLLQRNGQWVSPMAAGYLPTLPSGAAISEIGDGVPFVARRWPKPRTVTLSLNLPDDEARQWFYGWYVIDTKFGARRFGARLHLGATWRYCVCSFVEKLTPVGWGAGRAEVAFTVELSSEYATELELTSA